MLSNFYILMVSSLVQILSQCCTVLSQMRSIVVRMLLKFVPIQQSCLLSILVPILSSLVLMSCDVANEVQSCPNAVKSCPNTVHSCPNAVQSCFNAVQSSNNSVQTCANAFLFIPHPVHLVPYNAVQSCMLFRRVLML